jgi:hypothetical protein
MFWEEAPMPTDYDKIRKDNIRRRGEEFDDIGHLISEQLYSDRSHFVYELLQNAEDALERRFSINSKDIVPRTVQFRLYHDRLEFRHFGVPFNEEDVKGISDVLKGTKREDVVQIGKFGIGFKSVYAFTSSPEIHSGEEHFIIKRYIRPEAKRATFPIEEDETVFNCPFDHEKLSAKEAFDLILAKLQGLGPRVLLFLRWIDEIEWSVEPDGEKGHYLKDTKHIGNFNNARRITVIGQNNGKDEEENWLIFERPVPLPGNSETVRVEVSFRLEAEDKAGKNPERIVKVKDSPLVVYFPTEKATRFGFLIQGPYRTTPSRDNIPKDDEWNETLVKETAELIGDILSEIKDLGLLSVSFLEALPIRTEDFPDDSMFYPIVESVRNTLIKEALLPADDGSFVSAGNAKLASADWLRKLLQGDQISHLLNTKSELNWITSEITETGKHSDLWKYFRNKLTIDEISPDKFARQSSEDFLSAQPDDWFIDLYSFLIGIEQLWRAPRYNGDPSSGILRGKPILRLQDGRQWIPFKSDGCTPNAFLPPPEETDFPVVSRSIVTNEQACTFLKRLGLSEPNVFDDIVERVLPKYDKGDALSISEFEHAADINKILRALASDSEAGKKKVIEKAKQAPFLKAVSQTGETAFKKPLEIYLKTSNLKLYFRGNPEIWFLDEPKNENIWLELGVSKKPRFKEMSIELSWDDKCTLIGNQGHTKDIETTDYDLDGLDHFLSRFLVDNPPFREYSLIIWNFLLEHLTTTSHSSFYEAKFRWKYYHERSASFEATWKKRLRSHEWMPQNGNDTPHRPEELSLSDLPDEFDRSEKLADILGMKKDVVAKLAEEAGISSDDINFVRDNQDEFRQWKDEVSARKERPTFPIRPVANPERRQERLGEQLTDAPNKEYEKRERSVRTTNGAIDPTTWLRNQYTNEADQMVCQICKEEMPFRKRDGAHYFEKKEALSKKYLPKEHEAQYLALCPLCAAKYDEFVKTDDEVMAELREEIASAEDWEIPISLGDEQTSIRFVETHLHDLKVIMDEAE